MNLLDVAAFAFKISGIPFLPYCPPYTSWNAYQSSLVRSFKVDLEITQLTLQCKNRWLLNSASWTLKKHLEQISVPLSCSTSWVRNKTRSFQWASDSPDLFSRPVNCRRTTIVPSRIARFYCECPATMYQPGWLICSISHPRELV